MVVGTHRHGCCVIQRCIDHASGQQKADLIAAITGSAFALVQDPYGNYVLQYIIDLGDPTFTNPLCYSFQTNIPTLSKHKFSSNVIEKCIRHADPQIATLMIEEMLNANELEKMLRDSYANYVVQTALDHAERETRARLVDAIRPILPSIRHTPYGRRLQTKVTQDGTAPFANGNESGPQNGMARPMSSGRNSGFSSPSNRHGMYGGNMNGGNMYGGANGMGGPPPAFAANGAATNGHTPTLSNGSANFGGFNMGRGAPFAPPPVQSYGRANQANGYNFF